MSEHRSAGDREPQPHLRRRDGRDRLREQIVQQARYQNRNGALAYIQEKTDETESSPEDATDVRCADVLRYKLTNIDALGFAYDIAKVNGTQEVC